MREEPTALADLVQSATVRDISPIVALSRRSELPVIHPPETDILPSVVLHSSSSGLGQVCPHSKPVGCQQAFERTAEPSGQGSFPVDGPVEHGATPDLLDQPGQIAGVAG